MEARRVLSVKFRAYLWESVGEKFRSKVPTDLNGLNAEIRWIKPRNCAENTFSQTL
jgi:hypothetical protein